MVKYYQINEMNIQQIVAYHAPNKKYEIIDYSSNKMNVDCIKKKYPIMSFMIPKGQCIFTEIDMDMYKYKNIGDENIFYIINPLENTYVLFDSSKFYVGEGTKINVWDEDIINPYQDIESQEIVFENKNMNLDLKKIMYLPINIEGLTSKVNNIYRKNNYDKLYEINGNLVDDIIPFIEDGEIKTTNRFNRMKIIQTVLSKDVCYWIMNEADKQPWGDCTHKNYSNFISIEKIPGVLNFVLYSCHYWIAEVKRIFDMNLINLNVKEIFIAKDEIRQTSHQITSQKSKINDDSFIILNIQLNETTDGIFYDEDNILLNQGDMIVYNKKTIRERGNNYVLVLFIDIVL